MRPTVVVLAAATVLALSACGSHPTAPASPSGSSAPASSPGTSPPAPAGMSFDCANAANSAQRLVCNDPQLTDLDRRMQAGYQKLLAIPGIDQATIRSTQSAWAGIRDHCRDDRICVLEAYQTRLVDFATSDVDTAPPPVVTYGCPADKGPLTAQFYNQLDPQTAVLRWKDLILTLFIQPSGSGARYGRQGYEYWEHQGEVTLDFRGDKFVCHTQH